MTIGTYGLSPKRISYVAAVVTCHNYAHFLGECLDSILAQTVVPDEILVVDDASQDDPLSVCQRYDSVGFLRANVRCPLRARKVGLDSTRSPFVLFVDADNVLPPRHVECALREFTDRNIGGVYSDYQAFGEQKFRTSFPEYSREDLFCENFIDSCCMLRRDALEMAGDVWTVDYGAMPEDYFLAQRLVQEGWNFRKQSSVFHYRRHTEQLTQKMTGRRVAAGYAKTHGLDHLPITLFIPLSGRTWAWREQSRFLERQTFNHDRIRLVLCDTSQSTSFSDEIRSWLATRLSKFYRIGSSVRNKS